MNSFFQTLSQYQIKRIHIEIAFDFETNSVTVLTAPKSPANDQATHQLPELIINDTIDAIDSKYFETLNTPLEKTQEFFNNTLQFEARLKLQQQKTAEQTEKKNQIKKLEESLQKIKDKKEFDYKKESAKIKKIIEEIKTLDPKNKIAEREKKLLLENTQETNSLFQ